MAEMSAELPDNFFESLSIEQKNLLVGVINLNIPDLEISWDFDQVLMQSEIPTADYCDKDKGTKYSGRKIRGWNSYSKWLFEDGKFKTIEEAEAYEEYIWTHPKILKEAPPNKRFQALSFEAWRVGIKQSITTSRIPELAFVTETQVRLHFPWLTGQVNQRTEAITGVSGEDYKVLQVAAAYEANPSLVHLDDSMSFMRKILKVTPGLSVIGFPCLEDIYADMQGPRRVFFPDISMFNELIFYPEVTPWT